MREREEDPLTWGCLIEMKKMIKEVGKAQELEECWTVVWMTSEKYWNVDLRT